MYHYPICSQADKQLFAKQCKALEDHIPGLVKECLLHDVDDSFTQIYQLDGKRVLVHNSEYLGALYVDSEIPLEQFFK